MNATQKTNWSMVSDISSDNGLVLLNNKALPEHILAKFYYAVWQHKDTNC